MNLWCFKLTQVSSDSFSLHVSGSARSKTMVAMTGLSPSKHLLLNGQGLEEKALVLVAAQSCVSGSGESSSEEGWFVQALLSGPLDRWIARHSDGGEKDVGVRQNV